MDIHFGDKIEIKAQIEKVRSLATNMKEVSECIPDLQDFMQADEKNFTMKIKAGIAFVQGVFSIKGSMNAQGNSINYLMEGKGIGSTVRINLSVKISSTGQSTYAAWEADASIGGIAGGVSEGVIMKISEDKIGEIIENVRKKLE